MQILPLPSADDMSRIIQDGEYIFLERSTLDHKVRIDDPIEV